MSPLKIFQIICGPFVVRSVEDEVCDPFHSEIPNVMELTKVSCIQVVLVLNCDSYCV